MPRSSFTDTKPVSASGIEREGASEELKSSDPERDDASA